MKRSGFKPKDTWKRLKRKTPIKRGTKRLRAVGKVTQRWLDVRPQCVEEWRDVDFCTLQYDGCWRSNDGYCHSLKRLNRTKPQHWTEVAPSCSWCHLEILERMGKEKMAAEVRRVRREYGLPTYE